MRLELIIFFIFLASAIVLFAWKKIEKEVEKPQEKKPGGPQPPSPSRKKIHLANGVGLAIIILAAVIIYKMVGEEWFQPRTATAIHKVWVLDQTVTVSSNEWVNLPIKFDGKEYKFAPDTTSAEIEFVADGRYGIADSRTQFDFGEIRKSLKARAIKEKAVVYMYTANPS
ncbi:MAG: hypothetical protein UU85_C0004G0035 [Candidatus Wolfebacteria bacterium GW2011_GWA2_42_10]|uniref:Uncharacterized protein n=2 Tax=Candidatus Wolfeibacteriota TaxID=1752735 RepID=A0A0G0ZTH2_9BACT|nr:MAG: hypothetical protein UU38_C0001G0097 [Candidatus Wolfebacteria bacterium GW2011_GWB1_41_12]KKS25276.1 MAG: hypothetical protein UU85_C0004G0035 [Candidatus Wolfebacteria bacterium GW2011_GWA2_42_10]KKT56716.1 MAG: hypothetical protein UW50_C0001G0285 [Candidatus Wolfebacteria bacterium GW2011_GWA1_44_24]